MADPVGLAASIVGLATAALKVSKLCNNYRSEAMGARGDIGQLVSEITSLASLLGPLSMLAEDSRISQTSDSDMISQLVHQCTEMEQLLDELQCQLNKQSDSTTRNRMQSLKTSLKWPFKKEETQNRIQKIERLKTTVTLKLQLWVAPILCS